MTYGAIALPTDHPQFFAAMGWNEDEAVRIYSACEAAIAQEDYGKNWMFEVESEPPAEPVV